MPANLFADTSGWAELADLSQPYYKMMRTAYRQARDRKQKILTTNYVIAELVALLTSRLHMTRLATITFIEYIKALPEVEIVHVDPVLDDQAWQLLKSRRDKEWSLVDCASFVLMQQRGIAEALTTDQHFEQAGFGRLLK